MSHLSDIKTALQKVKPALAEKYNVSSIGIFGSVVRDNYSPSKSDIDILIDFNLPLGIEFIDVADLIEKELNKKLDLVSKKEIKDKYFDHIKPEIVYV